MTTVVPAIVLGTAVVTNGLLAGVFFVFACAIGPGLRRVDAGSYVQVFRAINTAILNGWFLSVFALAPLSAAASVVLCAWRGSAPAMVPLLVGAACSASAFGITATANVPLNRDLDRADVDTEQQCRIARRDFEARWNRWNLARTLTSIGALAFLSIAAVA